MNKVSQLALCVALTLGVAGCGSSDKDSITESATSMVVSGVEKANFDPAVRHQDDFYYSVNGTWLANTPIPADKSNYGSFSVLYEQSQEALKKIIDAAAAKPNKAKGSSEQKVGDFYASFMDTDAIEGLGISPLKDQLSDIAFASTHNDIATLMGSLLVHGSTVPFGFYVNNDAKNSSQYGVYLYQSGLTLPDRDYYLKDDEKFTANRAALIQYVDDLMAKAGYSDPKRASESVAKIEKFIAASQWSRVESRDANKSYNKMDRQQLQDLVEGFDFVQFSAGADIDKVTDVIVRQPSYFEKFGKEFSQFSVSEWQDYLAFHLVDDYAELLSKDFVDLHFAFHGNTLMGIEEQKPRWKKGVDAADQVIGELVGEEYVKQNFKPEAKAKMEEMIQNLIKGFEVSINELEWMTPETKLAAQEKLAKFTYKIGYPDKWKDYTALDIEANDLVGNYQRYAQFEYKAMLAKLGQPIDRTEWHMTPQTVNAYYSPVMNEIVFPAAILQPPFFNMDADDAINYGGIGAVIGHEISHGFDDQGAKYDGDGNLRDWWSDKDREEFQKRAAQLSKQYAGYEAMPGKFVNGDLTLGENIGDLGGLTVAARSYAMSLNGKPSPVIEGLTGEQRLFIGWSQVWRRNYRDEELGRRLMTDSHSPSHFRAMGTPRNIPAFYEAFDLKEGDKMFLSESDRVKIW
ncbi:peptidase M13 [Shewanella sp. Choline-02u-19]|uniref:M13 family metallopeptidase n=1 Tax=unclassified Shewanella TaxID=196818 RepID=UPI000C33A32B|nr:MULTISPECIES: M13-type metalloendopeptidase [unclassified Shewanella]PKG72729.1 peptidase M13 [Shewanella sp. GutCb]PKH57156.1 peptidase M13 [Shewanella sp. Bg11-22]PKI29729.1 peptidase M13 [Shewanella sp. Choline-02u-19]